MASPAPEEFQRRLNTVLEGLPGMNVIADIFLYGRGQTDEEASADYDKNLRLLMDRCQMKNLKLNAKKMQLRSREVTYMGHCITGEGFKVDPGKTRVIRDMPSPIERMGVQRPLGIAHSLEKKTSSFGRSRSMVLY